MSDWQEFVNFQLEQRGIVTAEDAARIAKTTRASIYEWGKRRCVKMFVHRGKHYVGFESLGEFVRLRPFVLGDERARRRRIWERHKKRKVDNG